MTALHSGRLFREVDVRSKIDESVDAANLQDAFLARSWIDRQGSPDGCRIHHSMNSQQQPSESSRRTHRLLYVTGGLR